jgi:hypothetical protein
MAASSPFRVVALALAGALVLALAIVTLTRSGADAAYKPPKVDQARMVLRLPDLPRGFVNSSIQEGEEDGRPFCSQLTHPPDTPPDLAEFVLAFHPRGCATTYASIFTLPGEAPSPAVIGSGVMALGSAEAADTGWEVVPTMLGRLFRHGGGLIEMKTTAKVGTKTQLLHARKAPFPYSYYGKKASFLVWRSGNTLATIMAVGDSFAKNDAFAVEMAKRQQARIRKPTPYTETERDDSEVGLDDPAIDVPVYWLGRTFKPGHGLPPNRFFDGYAPQPYAPTGESSIGLEEGPGAVLKLRYYNFRIDAWSEKTWPLYLKAKVSRVLTNWHCTKTREIAAPNGANATIYGGYRRNYERCPAKAPDVFTVWAEIGDMHIVVNSPWSADSIINTPYDSFNGMEAIVRALKLRPKPVY